MQKNTKILLGLGLIGLAYYLWQKSSKIKGLPSVIKPIDKGLNEKCSSYAGNQLAAMRFASAEAYDKAWKREYDKCMAGKMENQENPLLLKIREKNREIPIGQQNKCELEYLKALASAKQAASMGAIAGILPKEIFMKRCEEAKNKES